MEHADLECNVRQSLDDDAASATRGTVRLRVGASDDPAEREADRVADRVSAALSTSPPASGADGRVHRRRHPAGAPVGPATPPVETVARVQRSAPVIRRFMSSRDWEKSSSMRGRRRSVEVLAIDGALREYHETRSEPTATRMKSLTNLREKIYAWQTKHGDSHHGESNEGDEGRRRAAVMELLHEVRDERQRLTLLDDASDGSHGSQIHEIQKRAVRLLQRHLSLGPKKANSAMLVKWDDLLDEADALDDAADALASADSDDWDSATQELMTRSAYWVIKAMRTHAYSHFGKPRPDQAADYDRAAEAIDEFESWVRGRMVTEKGADYVAREWSFDPGVKFAASAREHIERFSAFAGPDASSGNGDRDKLVELLLGAGGATGDQIAYQGTSGGGNWGKAEAWTTAPSGGAEDERTSGQQNLASAFESMSSDWSSGTKDTVSGTSDMSASIFGLGSDVVTVVSAVRTLKDPDASDADRRAAKAALAAAPLSTLSNAYKFIGGALTAQRGIEGETLSSDFGFSASGTDGSTDIKMAGDFAAVFAGIINSIKETIDVFRHFGDRSDKEREGGTRRKMESLGALMEKAIGALTAWAGSAKAAMKLGYQIAGEGSAADASISAAGDTFMKHVVPGMGIIMGVLDTVHQTYKLIRIGMRRTLLSEQMAAKAAQADDTEMDAMRFAQDSLVKRTTRLGINLGHALAKIVAGGFNTSGIGLAPGMVISLSATAAKIGQVGARTAKQSGRDRKAKARAEKNAANQQDFESFAEFKLRKRMDAAGKGRWATFKTAIDMKVTYNWDKASENKAADTRAVAFEIQRMDDDVVYRAIGVLAQVRAEKDPAKQVAIIEKALRKRD